MAAHNQGSRAGLLPDGREETGEVLSDTRSRLESLADAWQTQAVGQDDPLFLMNWQNDAMELLSDILETAWQSPDRDEFLLANWDPLARLVHLVREALDPWEALAIQHGIAREKCQIIREGLVLVGDLLGLPGRTLH